jgi:hypothetical protein
VSELAELERALKARLDATDAMLDRLIASVAELDRMLEEKGYYREAKEHPVA